MPIEKGANLALDRILRIPQTEAITGVPEPEQFERLPEFPKRVPGQPQQEEERELSAGERLRRLRKRLGQPEPSTSEKLRRLRTEIQEPEIPRTLEGEEFGEGFVKDTWDAFFLGANQLLHNTGQFFVSALPNLIFKDVKAGEPQPVRVLPFFAPKIGGSFTPEGAAQQNRFNKRMREKFKSIYLENKERNEQWLRDHPELQPPERFKQDITQNLELLKDPGFWAFAIADAAAFSLGILGVTLGVGFATKNPYLALAAGTAVATPSQGQDLFEDLIASGATEEQASELAVPIGMVIASIETITDLPLLRAISPAFNLLKKNIQTAVVKRTVGELAIRGIKTAGVIEVAEVVEEVAQGAIQNATVKTFDENREIFADVDETVIRTLIATLPFAIFGGGMSMRQVSRIEADSVPPEQKEAEGWIRDETTGEWMKPEALTDIVEETAAQLEATGLTPEQAKMQALNEVAKTPEGQQALQEAAQRISEGLPVEIPEEVAKPIKPQLTQRQKELKETGVITEKEVPAKKVPAKQVLEKTEIEKKLTRVQKIRKQFVQKEKTQQETKQKLVDYIKKELPLEERGRLLTQVKNVTTDKGLQKAIVRVVDVAEQAAQKTLRTQITSEIKAARPKVKQGKVKGKFTADIQRQLNTIQAGLEGNRTAAQEKIALNIEKMRSGGVDETDVLALQEENERLSLVGIKSMNSTELQALLNDIKSLKETGKLARAEQKTKERERIDKIQGRLFEIFTAGRGLKAGTGSVPAKLLESKSTSGFLLDSATNWQYGWDNMMDKLSKFDEGSRPYESDVSKFGNEVHTSRVIEDEGRREQMDKLADKVMEFYGVTKKDINRVINQLTQEKINLGKVANARDETVDLILTKDQMIKKYQEMLDPTLETTFEKMAWTEKMGEVVIDGLSQQDKNYADWMLDFYQDYYETVNPIYREIYGVDLPKNPNYSPISRNVEDPLNESVLLFKEASFYASATATAIKARTKSAATLKFRGATEVLVNHIAQLEHFKAWSATISDMRRVFGDKDIRTSIRQYHGTDILGKIDGYINDFASGEVDRIRVSKTADFLRRNFTRSILGLKPVIGLKQIPSVIAFMTEMPTADFFTGVADFWKNPVKKYQFLKDSSPFARSRFKEGTDLDVRQAQSRGLGKQLTNSMGIADYFLFLIKTGDKFAIVQGMWAKYQSGLKEGLGHVEAMQAAEATARRTQPSFTLETLSPLQKQNSWIKLALMFQNQPNKYFRIIGDNARNFRYGRGSRAKAAGNIFLTWVILPALFQLVADAGRFKPEHQARILALGPLNYILAVGQMMQTMWGWLIDEPFDLQVSPVFSTLEDIKRAFFQTKKLIEDGQEPFKDITTEDYIKAVEYYAKVAGKALGLPTPYGIQVERAIREDDLRGLIFSQYSLRESKKKKTETIPKGEKSKRLRELRKTLR